MWFSTPSVESITRPRLAVALVSAVAAASIGYYALYGTSSNPSEAVPGGGLHRSNAIRRTRRTGRSVSQSSSTSSTPLNENIQITANNRLNNLGDSDTVIDEAGLDDWWSENEVIPSSQRAGHNIVNLLFRVSEDNARRNGCVHRGCQCNSCGMVPIRGVRYRCANCADFDLCETCESQGVHTKTHIFYKIRVPAPPFGPRQMQPVWYTGDPDTCRRNLPRNLIGKLSSDTGFERPELEAFWEQWTFMANTEWRDDPDELFLAMNRKTFERCLVPTGGSRYAAPNLIHDRMFAFYDSNKDGLIGFAEFLQGLSYRKRKDKLRKVFEGYDIDGDGYVNRKDFLRMFRAYYVLYKHMHKDILDGLEDQLLTSNEAQQLIASRQPLSSLFGREGRVPRGDRGMNFEGKTFHRNGDVDLDNGTDGVVAEDRGDTASRQDILTSLFAYESEPTNRRRAPRQRDLRHRSRNIWGAEDDRPYLVTLIDPPGSLEDLPDAIMGDHTLDLEDDADDESNFENGEGETTNGLDQANRSSQWQPSESESRARTVLYNRRRTVKLEKRRRDMARSALHERWKRRQFYLDEEEGGAAPNDWEDDEDIFSDYESEDGQDGADDLPASSHSDSKVRFAPFEEEWAQSAASVPRGINDKWGASEIPGSEKDAGKEILYQVTQQAFNELLDTIFKPVEDMAVEARLTKNQREIYRDAINAYQLPDKSGEQTTRRQHEQSLFVNPEDDRSPENKSLEELLDETGYSVDGQEPRNAVDLGDASSAARSAQRRNGEHQGVATAQTLSNQEHEQHDPTLPQFLPDSITWDEVHSQQRLVYPITRQAASHTGSEEELRDDVLEKWKRLGIAEQKAIERGGWGKLSFAEFEKIYRSQEYRGNRLDYLGSWIDFCIP